MGKKPFDTGLTVAAGAVSAGLAVAFGAFGAHLLAERLPADLLAVYETAARYHFYHSLGLLAVGLLALQRQRAARSEPPRLRWSAALMLTGIVLFSGSLYTMALTGQRWLGAVTPFGGAAFLLAWGLLAWEALAGRGGSVMGLARGPCGRGQGEPTQAMPEPSSRRLDAAIARKPHAPKGLRR